MYKVRAWLAIAELRALSAKWRERRELVSWYEERRGYGVAYIGAQASTVMEQTKHRHGYDTPRIKKMHEKIGGQQG